ncbi:alpha/beta fold hydrolase [Kitasatospora sp. NPDC101183]|uniref:alpha/beta fold hydrolase n=1 Tax=Kitasatospora sp. NPDC101183 TaxID=3364100 RepID=UPI0038083F91
MTIPHEVAGEGPAVVLLHSSVCDRRMWDGQWRALVEAGYRVVRLDFRGFGESPMADAPYSDAGDVLDLLDHLGVGSTALVGASYGGKVALEVAASRPGAVTALALLAAGMPGHAHSAELRAFGAREDELLEAGDVAGAVELNVEAWLGPEAGEEARARVREMQRHAFEVQLAATEFFRSSPEVDLGRVTARCLAVAGAHDFADFREIAAALSGRIAGPARHLELEWAGHLPGLERPEAVTRLLLDFLGE